MQKMKYSGIEWIGEIPDNWDKIKIKNLCNKIYAGGTPSTDVFEYWDGDIPWLPSGACHDNIINQANIFITEKGYKNSSTKLIPKNTTIIAMTGATCANVGYITFDSCANQSVTAFVNNHNLLFSKYLFYTLQGAREYILTYQTGGAQAGINVENCRNLIIPITGIKEQKLIADFLDEKVDIIDKIIGDLNNQIEILNKYKKQIITETVTSGLNKNAKFKDSGIDWMGEIPEHWEIKRLKYLGSARNGLTYEPEDQCDEGMLVLRSSNIQDGKLCLDDNVYVNMKVPKNIILKRNDLLICSRNGSRNLIGKNILIEDSIEGNTYGAFMCVFRSKYNKYIHYVLNSNIFDHYLNTFLTSTINQLTNSNLYSIKIAIPMDIEEQQEIVKYLDDRCQKIDEILNSKIKQKKQMEQYKKSVIYEYVTGKKRVEGAEELYG